eukprot:CAMPEP_0119107516 /NCGR_PEP_ID=MMETSP1180-20130426/10688_1 /TAXON_ID=3052 ORGANISM="Chlamydomonas cf sp, Strain CCMP681" /NCGR_SAMPLE_ID=MMETSP1180 /ASSEMBLY_ACC=CAM_ASM_000741 /LENGTH=93 /DNA_ID=CAMNT_0007093019 /DNA_START=152 /DNA_END=433 /DNA_ORIENTATION=-
MSVSADGVKQKLLQALGPGAADVTVVDTSGGCGAAFQVSAVAVAFEGKSLLARHRIINDALKEEMTTIHALSILKTLTPAQEAKAAGASASAQ